MDRNRLFVRHSKKGVQMFRKAKTIFEEIKSKNHDEDFEPDELPTPTGARPGSLEKLFVIIERVERGESLWSPHDEAVLATINQQREALDYVNRIYSESLRERRLRKKAKGVPPPA